MNAYQHRNEYKYENKNKRHLIYRKAVDNIANNIPHKFYIFRINYTTEKQKTIKENNKIKVHCKMTCSTSEQTCRH